DRRRQRRKHSRGSGRFWRNTRSPRAKEAIMADAQALRTAEVFPLQAVSPAGPRRQVRRLGLQGWEFPGAVAFVIPYVGVFLAFLAYPVVYGLGLGSDPALYAELMPEPIYQRTVVNTVLYIVIGVNLKM